MFFVCCEIYYIFDVFYILIMIFVLQRQSCHYVVNS